MEEKEVLEPLGHRLLVRPDRVDKVTSGGIHLADETVSMKERACRTGIIIDIGPTAWKGIDDGTPWAAIGDRIFFRQYSSASLNDKDAQDWIINDEDVLGRFRRVSKSAVKLAKGSVN